MKNRTMVERKSERELVITRTFDSLARTVYAAWTQPSRLKQWWAPKSSGASLLSCEADVRVGGSYRFEFGNGGSTMTFFGKYVEVVPNSRLVWTNDESEDGAVTTVTFEENAGQTALVMCDLYPSKAALDASIDGMEAGMTETFGQLDELLVVAHSKCATVSCMKSAQLPPVRVEPSVREEIEAVLRDGESLSEFVETSAVEAARRRKAQEDFLIRGRASLAEAKRTGEFYDVDEVLAGMRARLHAKIQPLRKRAVASKGKAGTKR